MDLDLLWFDDSKRPLAEKLATALERYYAKFGEVANRVYCNPADLEAVELPGVTIETRPWMLRCHFQVGRDDDA